MEGNLQTKITYSTEYICPNCRSTHLRVTTGQFDCDDCQASYSNSGDFPSFRNGKAKFFWGTSQQEMERVIQEVPSLGWHDSFMGMLGRLPLKEAKDVFARTAGARRHAFHMFLPLTSEDRVLDIGSGWGTISINFARHCKQVTSMDQMEHHLLWLKNAAADRKIKNIRLVQAGDTKYLPFPENSFDVVILNGVLEWVASNTTGDPETVQQALLNEITRVLVPNGTLYIGIENRTNYRYFKGVPEGHIHIKYGTLVPRQLTDWYLRATKGVPYREYTYTLFGYRKLLKNAALSARRFFVTWPHYSTMYFGLSLDSEGDAVEKPWELQTKNKFARRPLSYFSRAFGMTGSKGAGKANLLDRVVSDFVTASGWSTPVTILDELFQVTSTGKTITKLRNNSGEEFILRTALVPEATQSMETGCNALHSLRQSSLSISAIEKLPTVFREAHVDGYYYTAEPLYKGLSGESVITKQRTREVLCDQAYQFLIELSSATAKRIVIDEINFTKQFAQPIRNIRTWFTTEEWLEVGPWCETVIENIRKIVHGKESISVARHADFVPSNCLVRENGELLKVLDWELYQEASLPLYDWITFLGCAHRPDVRAAIASTGENPDLVKFPGFPTMFSEGVIEQRLQQYMKDLSLDASLIKPLLFMWWIMQLNDWEDTCLYDPEWRQLRVLPVIERLKAFVASW